MKAIAIICSLYAAANPDSYVMYKPKESKVTCVCDKRDPGKYEATCKKEGVKRTFTLDMTDDSITIEEKVNAEIVKNNYSEFSI